METTADLIVFIGTAVTSLTGIYVIGRMDEEKEKREMARRRKELRRGVTNYARMRAVLATSSEVIRKG